LRQAFRRVRDALLLMLNLPLATPVKRGEGNKAKGSQITGQSVKIMI
jgi:hypothetical protein